MDECYPELSSLRGQRIIVTGGARGIGGAAVRFLAQQGAQVAIFDINDDLGEALAASLSNSFSAEIFYSHVDVASKAEVANAVPMAIARLGGLEGLINVAGIERQAPIENIAEDDFDMVLRVNLKGTFLMSQAVFPFLKDHGGSIINVGSDLGLDPPPLSAHYATSKGAVHSLTRAAALEWAKYNIRVNAILPAMWTEAYDEFRSRQSSEELKVHDQFMAGRIHLGGRLGDPNKDLAPVIGFLMSDSSRFITSQLIPVNGGLGSTR
ncbi:hypothetical protein PENARI_c056G00739 [Penicillium arizonense]|uniref:Uncharacterized protein n=1 Tax=Penicillium arizonense TaxID=1835702 RepID=A0A1F5L1U7_PENAI|nr:hypothetical protein PENARI_c056G00739 [Penicillium arizonense]OGE47184.1 hypothetical protein PENARI_c056G00739 [Penicillium arizonense]